MASGQEATVGYDCEFVEPPPKVLQVNCPICLLVLRKPHLTSCCGNSFCESCIGAIKSRGNPCPYCKQPDFTTLANQGLRRVLSEFQVHCPHRGLGCAWADALGELDKHVNANPQPATKLEGCLFTDVACVYCEHGVQRRVLADHQNEECSKRPYTCEYCEDYESTFDDVTSTHWAECRCFPVPCPNSCSLSDSGIKPQDLEHHVAEECPLTVVECELRHAGCEVKLSRKDMAAHMKEKFIAHISLLAAENQKLVAENQKLVAENQKLVAENQSRAKQSSEMIHKLIKLTEEITLVKQVIFQPGRVVQTVPQPNYEVQKRELQSLLQQKLKTGDKWFLVDMRWMKQWKRYVGYDQWDQSNAGQKTANPGPMDNSGLFKDSSAGTLKDHLMEELDYSLLPEPAWIQLFFWYGLTERSRPIPRKVVEYGLYMKHCKVEVYLLEFKLSMHPNLTKVTSTPFSRAATVADLEQVLRRTYDVPSDAECRVWHRYMTHTYELLSSPTQTLQDAGLYNGQTIVLEQKNKDGTWPRTAVNSSTHPTRSSDNITGSATASSSYSSTSGSSWGNKNYGSSSSSSGYSSYWSSGYSQQPTTPGLCGLSNLGKTCFMNSALQCLSNTQPLTEYFIGEDGEKPYKKHVNKQNPLGMGGAIAEAYGALLDDMWSGKVGCVAPRHFKVDHFIDNAQHDSEKLLAFLLNGLHEDLNLVKSKPYVDLTVKSEGRYDHQISDESWYKYLLRNQSVIVSVFQGQLKSTLHCPQCNKVSKIFDPFMFLSLPLPVKKLRNLFVCVVRADPMKTIVKYKVGVPKRGCVLDLKKAVEKLTNIPPEMMVIADVYNSRFHRLYVDRDSLTHIMDRDDIFIYELSYSLDDKEWVQVPVYHREEVKREVRYTYQSYTQQYYHLFGLPMVVAVPRPKCSYRDLYTAVTDKAVRYLRPWSEVKEQPAEKSAEEKDFSEEEGGEKDKREMDLFSLCVVNSYGSQVVQKLKDNDSVPLRLTSHTYISCEWRSEVKDSCYLLEVAEEVQDDESCSSTDTEGKKNIQLKDCLQLFTVEEELGKDDQWFCPTCKDSVRATKKFDLWKLPEILVIHLKRFSYDRYWRDKLDVLVNYPVTGLDLTDLSQNPNDPEPIYDLYGIINHFGGMGGGHYTAYCKNKDNGKWYNFDDSHVAEMSEDRLVAASGYVLFYRRCMEVKPSRPPLDRTLSHSFVEEVKQRRAKYPSTSKEDVTAQSEDKDEAHESKRQRNESGGNDVFMDDSPSPTESPLDQPD